MKTIKNLIQDNQSAACNFVTDVETVVLKGNWHMKKTNSELIDNKGLLFYDYVVTSVTRKRLI